MSKNFLCGAGHGGNDSGAISVINTYEKDLNLTLSKEIFKKVEKYLPKSYLLRDKDTYISLLNRCMYANNKAPLYWFEFHFNAYDGKANGIEIFTSKFTSQNNKDFASFLCKEFSKQFSITNRGAQTRLLSSGKDYYYLHRNTNANVTVFIIEPGFIDNEKDFKIISSSGFMKKASDFFAKNIIENLYNIKYEEKMYIVQTGAFSDIKNAKKQVDLLKSKGINSIIKETTK